MDEEMPSFEHSLQNGHLQTEEMGGMDDQCDAGPSDPSGPRQPQGSPQASVDESSLQKQRDKNRLSLKVKLMLRRPVNQLVDQGIMPPPKTPSAFFEQRRHLERARTGDILKTKIQRRPDREALVQQHILEDTRIAPSLHDRQRKLKRAKLADYLNDKIAHRPGPLELVQGNILRLSSNDTTTNPIIDGSISFRKTCEGETGRPTAHDLDEEDGSSSASSPTSTLSNLKDLQVTSPTSVNGIPSTPGSLDSLSKAPSPASVVVSSSSCPSPQQLQFVASSLVQPGTSVLVQRRRSSTESDAAAPLVCSQGHPGTSVALPSASSSSGLTSVPPLPTATNSTGSSSQRRNSNKKCRIKPPVPQKTRTIKFHEYKGPPVVQNKNISKPAVSDESSKANITAAENETAYRLLLKQQQLFLQWELEAQQKRVNVEHKELSSSNNAAAQVVATHQPQQAIKVENEPQPVVHHAIIRNVENSRPSQAQHVTVAFPIQGQIPVPPPANNLIIRTVVPSTEILQPPTPAPSLEDVKPVMCEKSVEEKPKKPFKLDDLKVSDLKAELKKRSLPVSGAKTQLLERLKIYFNANPDDQIGGASLSLPNSGAESPPEIKREEQSAMGDRSVTAEAGVSTAKPFELPSLTSLRPGQQLSFLQLDPVQQQQATAIALQTLALQIPNGVSLKPTVPAPLAPQIQNLQIGTIPSAVPMDVDQHPQTQQQPRTLPQQTVLNTLPTIFLATSQPTNCNQVSGLTFQSTPLQMQQNGMPYIITMNGLNSTLNLINGFNFNAVINDCQKVQPQNNQPMPQVQPAPPPPPPPVPAGIDLEQTSMQKLQQHLQQKLLLQQMHKQDKKSNIENPSVGTTSNCSTERYPTQTVSQNGFAVGTAYGGDNGGVCGDSVMTDGEAMSGVIQNGSSAEEEDDKRHLTMMSSNSSCVKGENNGNCFAPHCSFPPLTTDCIKSEAIDDVLEILIRNGELPPSAAQDALPKSVILQHSPKPPATPKNSLVSSSSSFYDRRLSNPSTSFLYSDQPSPPSNTFPLPPISSISPANHGSPVSQHSNTETADLNAIQQQLALLEYLSNQQQQSLPQDYHDISHIPQATMNSPMDYSSADSSMYYNNAFNSDLNSGNNLANQQQMNDDDISALLDNWLAGNGGGFLGNSAGDGGYVDRSNLSMSPFHHEEMQADAFHDATGHNNAMDTESFLGSNGSSMDSMFDMFFGDLSHPTSMAGSSGSYLAGINTLAGQNVGTSMFWPESEQML